jgi:hypothetical protein
MMQIHVDPAGLSQEQREAVAGFILAYPHRTAKNTLDLEVRVDTSQAHAALAEIQDSTQAVSLRVPAPVAAAVAANPAGAVAAIESEISHLAREGGEFDASLVFGQPGGDADAVAAFGSAPAPLPPGATVAPAPAASAPAVALVPAPAITPAPAHSGVDLDKTGLPWDARIHAESKNKIADGTWRKKRNLDPALLATVEAELRQVMGAPAAPNVAAGSQVVQAPAAQIVAPPPPAAPSAPAIAPPPAATAAPAGDARQIFVGLVGRASAAIQGGKVTQAEVNQCCAAAGVPALPLLANRLDLVAQVAAQVDALIASRP